MAYGNSFQRFVYDHSPGAFRDMLVTIFSRGRGKVKFGPRYHQYLADLDRTQWYDRELTHALRDEKLRRIMNYAARFVPYYRGLFQELGLDPTAIRTAADLAQVPILDKATVRANMAQLRSELYLQPELVERFQTSGTTGRALEIYVTKDCLQIEKAFTWHHRRWGGVEVGDLAAAFVGFPVVPLKQRHPPFWVHDRSENRLLYSLQHMSRDNLPAYVNSLSAHQPRFIYGYPTAIYLMATHFNETRARTVRPKAVFTASETLLPHQRAEIERAFACRVFDWYGASEFIANIVQCEQGNYHVKPEYGIVEILRADGSSAAPGEPGELVCTGLNNLAMPFLRYRIGDMAIPQEGVCSCGRAGDLVQRITGRVEDVIVTPDGRWVTRLDFIFKGLTNVEEAQLMQDRREHLQVRVVKRPGYSEADEKRILANLRERLGPDMTIEFAYLNQIPRTASGKFRYVISRVSLGMGSAAQTGDVIGAREDEIPGLGS